LFLLEGARIGEGEAEALRLAAALRARGHRVVIGVSGKHLLEEVASRGHTTLSIPGFANLPGGVRAVARACRAHAIDLVNAHSLRMTLLAGIARRLGLSKAPLVATIHGEESRLQHRVARTILERLPDEVIFVSRYERERLAEAWGRAVGQVIYSGVELPWPGATEPIDLEAKHGVPRDARVIGFVGELSPEKAVGDAIAALVRLPDDVWLCIVGDGAEENALRAEARRRRVERRVVFVGKSSEAERYLVSFCALVLPSRLEGLPVTLRDAGALSIPVIAADVGGVREIVVPRETGLLYPTGDVDALVRALRGMLDDPSRAAALGCAARQRIAKVFGVKRWADEIEALFASVAQVE
jgi:glycosyltransferase involved in cell wall biosynthesis